MRHGDTRGMGRNDGISFRCISGPVRHSDGGRELWRKVSRYFVVGLVLTCGLLYGGQALLGHSSEIVVWLNERTGLQLPFNKALEPVVPPHNSLARPS